MKSESQDPIIAKTQEWLEKAVIGLNLCPFAKAVHLKKQIRYVVSSAKEGDALLHDLILELRHLTQTDPLEIDTTLLIHPDAFVDFLDYNEFLSVVDEALIELDLEGVLQIASFHPQYQFAGTEPDDITNYTNRSPYPTLHLLREESLSKAVDSYPHVEDIPDKNIETLKQLGIQGWKNLFKS